jgi:Flp pilus assembly protein TadG
MRSLLKFLLRLARCSSGSAMIEMTIVAPVAILLAAGGVDFGWWVSTQATLEKSVRDAARYLGSLPASQACSTGTTGAVAYAQNLAVYGNVTGTGSPLLPGWSVTNLGVGSGNPNIAFNPSSCPEPYTLSQPDTSPFTITVSATYAYTPIFLGTFCYIFSSGCITIGTFTLQATHEEPQVGGQ